ncbi:GNAT family N-acetyltransferase [Sphingomonas solaris]|uniref:GNAT family N-acetyltransferase n=1 Tax=Alterirhizorhabdus solaris TaxID=2529389 RepID=A0A558QYR5_9SPHN|nr:GNAT family N-acetyltransferase [Sphingomonas solaris]TVV72296.1 GNAT family N-acetyltransferase [Sphingomonas solaris]
MTDIDQAVTIRRAVADDVTAMLRLIVALAVYEREPDAVKATPESLTATMFGPDAKVFAHVAEQDGAVIGVALWFETYSTWTGAPSLYLEDLFVDPAARGSGAGKALFTALAREAKARGCARIDWAVLDWNRTARGFYTAMGGFHSTGWEPWRIEGEALERLAGA